MELFFRFWKNLKMTLLWSKKTKPRFFEFLGFGHNSTSNNSVAYSEIVFLMRSFDVADSPIKHFFLFFPLFFWYVIFFVQKGVFNFRTSKKRLTRYNHLSSGFQKGKNIWNRFSRSKWGGGVPRVYTEVRPYMYSSRYCLTALIQNTVIHNNSMHCIMYILHMYIYTFNFKYYYFFRFFFSWVNQNF